MTDTTDHDSPGGDPAEPEAQPRSGVAGWWLGLAIAVAFLLGTVGFLVGTRIGDDGDTYGPVDIGFLVDMTEHHDQAVEMALLQSEHGENVSALDFATEVIVFQRWELGIMDRMLAEAGVVRPPREPSRITMDWMAMPTPASEMPGMASTEQMEALAEARGLESDIMFLELMREHHSGGVHMAEYAAVHAEHPAVRDLAARMARKQAIEIREYTILIDRLREQT